MKKTIEMQNVKKTYIRFKWTKCCKCEELIKNEYMYKESEKSYISPTRFLCTECASGEKEANKYFNEHKQWESLKPIFTTAPLKNIGMPIEDIENVIKTNDGYNKYNLTIEIKDIYAHTPIEAQKRIKRILYNAGVQNVKKMKCYEATTSGNTKETDKNPYNTTTYNY